MPYATPADMTAFYDVRSTKDLVSDTGTAADSLDTNPVLLRMLSAAEGEVNSAIQVGNAYTADQIETMLAAAGPGADLLTAITCHLAMAYLLKRRIEKSKAGDAMLERVNEAYLDPLRKGTRILGVEGREDASVATADNFNVDDLIRTNPMTYRVKGFYPSRAASLPANRGF